MLCPTHVTITWFRFGHTSKIRRIDPDYLIDHSLLLVAIVLDSICDPVPTALIISRVQFGIIEFPVTTTNR